jgi:hypothetical protein
MSSQTRPDQQVRKWDEVECMGDRWVSDAKDQIREGKLQGRYRKRGAAIYLLSRSLGGRAKAL